MKLYAPKYYTNFACIADKCTHSCCIGWEIDIDSRTMQKYALLTHGYGKEIADSIDTADVPHFRLAAGERCPHLDETGLCHIITELGEEYLCDICRKHPRFYNNTSRGKEVGLGMACEEACRLILGSDGYDEIIEIGKITGETERREFDTIPHREKIYAILSDPSMPYLERLRRIYSKYGVSPDLLSDGEWRSILTSLEYLDDAHKALFSNYSSDLHTPNEWEKSLERALAYFIFRHCTDARDAQEFRVALGFSLFCERLLASMARAEKTRDTAGIVRLARSLSEEIEYSEENTEAIQFEFSFL